MKKIVLLFLLLLSTSVFSKTVNLSLKAKLSTCPKNNGCVLKETTHNFSIKLAPLADTGLDYGIGDLTFKSPLQKFGFKVIASSLEIEDQVEVVFLIMDEAFRVNTFTLVMNIPEILNAKLRVNSPVFTDSKGGTSSLTIEVVGIETIN